jgi:integrase
VTLDATLSRRANKRTTSTEPKQRGVFERPPDSGVWWVQFFDVNGKRRREKVGRYSDAVNRYDKLKAEIRLVKTAKRAGVWVNDPKPGVTISELIDDALLFVANHKDKRNYVSRGEIVRTALGDRVASSLTPQDLDKWLKAHCTTAATSNRYKAFLSLCFREGIANRKVTANPVRSVRPRREPKGRQRFLSREEYNTLHDIVADKFPEHLAEFVISVHTGMRLSEQYSVTWRQVHMNRKRIELSDTKNTEPRTVHLNTYAIKAIESLKPAKPKSSDLVFSSTTKDFTTRAWFDPCLEAAEIDDYTWHNNRHTFCSWLAMVGATIKEIQDAAGHKTIAMSARYAHLSPHHTASVVERLTSDAS